MRANRTALAVFAAALAVRGAVWTRLASQPEALMRTDSATYLLPARNLLVGHGFSSDEAAPFNPEGKRTPGYPAFLAALGASAAWASAVQVVLDSAVAALSGLGAALVSGHPAAAWLGLLYGLDPVATAHAPLILSETLFTFLIVLSVLLLLRAGDRSRTPAAAASGLCLGAATLARPISLYLWLPWSLALAWAWRGEARKRALVFAASAALLPAAWCGRNLSVFGHFEFSSITGLNALLWEAAAVQAYHDGTELEAGRERVKAEFRRRHPQPMSDAFQESHARSALAGEVLARYPLETARLHIVSTLKMLLGPGLNEVAQALSPRDPLPSEESLISSVGGSGTMSVLRVRPRLWPVLVWTEALLLLGYALAALGAGRLWRFGRRTEAAVVLVPLLYLLLLSAGGWSYYRFRLPLTPFFAILAGAAFLRK